MSELLHVGLDVGSTTVKIIVMDKNGNTLYKTIKDTFQTQKIMYVVFWKIYY